MRDKHRLTWKVLVAAGFGLLGANIAVAQTQYRISPNAFYLEEIKRRGQHVALDESLFGDSINLQDGTVSFLQDDVVLQTNGELKLSFTRKTPPQTVSSYGVDFQVISSRWEIDVPYMMGTFNTSHGWNVGPSPSRANRCSNLSVPAVTYYANQNEYLYIEAAAGLGGYWLGISVNIPGANLEQVWRIDGQPALPSDGSTYVGTTESFGRISCLPNIRNGDGGEGFVAKMPNGTTYYFDWMAIRETDDIRGGSYNDVIVPLSDIYLYATRAVDRFGNSITYTYDPQHPNRLTSMKSSDGAQIDVHYDAYGNVSSVDAGGRTWRYAYSPELPNYPGARTLLAVERPDGSKWTYEYQGHTALPGGVGTPCQEAVEGRRSTDPVDPSTIDIIRMTHPSGAHGEFKFRRILHGTNDTPGGCSGANVPFGVPRTYAIYSLYNKKIEGSGVQPRSWSYMYYPSWSYACTSPCASTSSTTVSTNDGVLRTYVFGNDYNSNAGKLLAETIQTPSGATGESKSYTYWASTSGQPFPTDPGKALGKFNFHKYRYEPLRSVSTQRSGVSFTRTVNSFDAFARPLSVTKSSVLAP